MRFDCLLTASHIQLMQGGTKQRERLIDWSSSCHVRLFELKVMNVRRIVLLAWVILHATLFAIPNGGCVAVGLHLEPTSRDGG
jgi:hypothetical protein